MENSESIVIILGLLVVLFTTLKMLRGLFLLLLQMFKMKPRYRDLKPVYKPFLQKYFRFYTSLSANDKKHFEQRVQFFIDLKTFIPRGGMRRVSAEVKTLIAGSAIQITYGYPNVYFRHFNRILVYPDNYKNKITKQYHKGEVNVKGIIVLSVKSLMHGWVNETDGVNLGLHEMAHAFGIENLVRNEEFGYIDQLKVKQLKELARPVMDKINSGEVTIFRKYGGTSFREFFSVAVEVFFETPDVFIKQHPKIYELLCELLNVSPQNIYNKVS